MHAATSSKPVIGVQPSLSAVVSLLEAAGLPSQDLTPTHLQHFFYCGSRAAPTGLVGVELYGPEALLRSLLVLPGARGGGMGSMLVEHAEAYARSRGARAMYLLTTSAGEFFRHRGYQHIARAGVVPAIQTTREFCELCPETSEVMAKALEPIKEIKI